jgi:hypothetical protein
MAMSRGKNVVLVIFAIEWLLLAAQLIEGAPAKRNPGNTESKFKSRVNNGAQWKAHPEKGWVRADASEEQGDTKKENPKRIDGKLRTQRANQQKR